MAWMAPVVTEGIDSPVSEVGQWVATVLTWGWRRWPRST